jgi:D-proline reductase (dithiol) PrdB
MQRDAEFTQKTESARKITLVNIIEDLNHWRKGYADWQRRRADHSSDELSDDYPFVKNRRAPFTPARRALPMLNLALISSAGAYIDGTEPFDTKAPDGDFTFKEIPVEVEPSDLRFASRGFDPTAVTQDRNAEVPIERLFEFERNGIIGQLNPVFWSFCGFIPDASLLSEETAPKLVERLIRHEVQAALLVPASLLCHQSVGILARAIESAGIPTMTIAVVKQIVESVRPPRVALYDGELGSISGKPNFPEHQRRILDEALRLIEPMDQPGIQRLAVELESQVEAARGER